MTYTPKTIQVGTAVLPLEIRDGQLHSLGAVTISGAALRNPSTRFLSWFDTFEGETFRYHRADGGRMLW
jgi:hypothetical protein